MGIPRADVSACRHLGCEACHGARAAEGPVLAMLAPPDPASLNRDRRPGTLRVAPVLPSPALLRSVHAPSRDPLARSAWTGGYTRQQVHGPKGVDLRQHTKICQPRGRVELVGRDER
jgi:hypothetical protein